MKKKFLLVAIMILAIVCLFSISALAATTITEGELSYELTEGEEGKENTAVIKSKENATFTNTEIVIPAYVTYNNESYKVIAINNFAFKNTNITKVVFEDECRLDSIGNSVFYNCNSLTSIDFGKAQIKKIGDKAFGFSEVLTFVNNRLPDGFTEFSGSQQFDNCNAMKTLIFPSSFTYFNTDTRIQSSSILNLVFEGKMTHVFLGYNKKHNLGGMTVHLTQNSVEDLNGPFVETIIHNNEPFFRNELNVYTTKTTGTLSITLSSNDANSNGNQYKDSNGVQYSRVNPAQDRLYFCQDEKVVPIVRTSRITGSYTTSPTGFFAVYDANALEVPEGATTNPNETYKLITHFVEKTVTEEANCLHGAGSVTYCYCGHIISSVTNDEVGPHSYEADNDCTTATVCKLCDEIIVEALTHNEVVSITYVNGYTEIGVKTTACSNEGCNHSSDEDVNAIFAYIGFSSDIATNSYITVGYLINQEALAEYKSSLAEGVAFSYGFVGLAARADATLNTQPIDATTGKVIATNMMQVNLDEQEGIENCTAVDFKIAGDFKNEVYAKAQLGMALYTSVKTTADGEATYVIKYIVPNEDNGTSAESIVPVTYLEKFPTQNEEVTE